MYAERATLVVHSDDLIRQQALAVFAAATGSCACEHSPGRPGPLAEEMRIQSMESIDEDMVRVTLVHRDVWDASEVTVRRHNGTELRSVG